jgi:hypothetical protein
MSGSPGAAVTFEGDWRLEAVELNAAYDQRFVVNGSADGNGTYEGTVGNSVTINGDGEEPWTVTIQHNDGSGWEESRVRTGTQHRDGSSLWFRIESEDAADRDYDDFVLRAEKVGMIEVTTRPYAIRTDTLQMTPEGIFEATIGRYYMGVDIKNVWTEPLPADSRVGVTPRSETTLSAGGIDILNNWRANELERLGQEVERSDIRVGSLNPWETRTVYFKLDASEAQARKHDVEFELVEPAMPDPNHPNRRTSRTIFTSRTTYDGGTGEFSLQCPQGRLVADIEEIAVEYSSFKQAVECVREHRGANPDDRAQELLAAAADGERIDLCELRQALERACCDAGGGDDRGRRNGEADDERGGRRRTGEERQPGRRGEGGWPCEEIIAIPTAVEYTVEPDPAYTGQHGPLPYADPWWKAVLAVIAAVLVLAAGASAANDLANKNDDRIIGSLHESMLETEPGKDYYLVDAALCELNGNRDLPASTPPIELEDAERGERFTHSVKSLDGTIDLADGTVDNDEISNIVAGYDPTNPSSVDRARVYKSGARSGTTHGVLVADDVGIERRESDSGDKLLFEKQVRIDPVPGSGPAADQVISQGGDSGSLWVHKATDKIVALNHAGPTDDSGDHGIATRIEDVINKLDIRFS